MTNMSKITLLLTLMPLFMMWAVPGMAGPLEIKTGTKYKLDDGRFFVCNFDKRPSMGTVILKVTITDSQKKTVTDYVLTGNAGMPEMSGAHDTGDREFKKNKKGVYLLPVDLVMPGRWEVVLKFSKEGREILSGAIHFDI